MNCAIENFAVEHGLSLGEVEDIDLTSKLVAVNMFRNRGAYRWEDNGSSAVKLRKLEAGFGPAKFFKSEAQAPVAEHSIGKPLPTLIADVFLVTFKIPD